MEIIQNLMKKKRAYSPSPGTLTPQSTTASEASALKKCKKELFPSQSLGPCKRSASPGPRTPTATKTPPAKPPGMDLRLAGHAQEDDTMNPKPPPHPKSCPEAPPPTPVLTTSGTSMPTIPQAIAPAPCAAQPKSAPAVSKPCKPLPATKTGKPCGAEEDEDAEERAEAKRYNACEAKLRRICEPKQQSGKVEADEDLVSQWRKKGHSRTQLVKLMMEADGSKDRVGSRGMLAC